MATPTTRSPALLARQRAVESRRMSMQGRTDRAREVLDLPNDLNALDIIAEQERLAVEAGDLDAAATLVERWPHEPEPRARLMRALWSAVIADQRGDEDAAVELVASVVDELEAEEHVGLFLSVGRPLVRPLRSLYRIGPSPFLRRVIEQPILAARSGDGHARGLIDHLTEQEMIVLGYLPSRMSNPAIAQHLEVSLNTIKTHLKHIYQKFDVGGRADAIEAAERLGLL